MDKEELKKLVCELIDKSEVKGFEVERGTEDIFTDGPFVTKRPTHDIKATIYLDDSPENRREI